jgi:integrase/recombinase XerC
MGRADLAGAAHLELVSGVVQLRPEDAMFEAMLSGWRAQQAARGLRDDTIGPRERLVRRFLDFTSEYPWAWSAGHMDEWSLHMTAEQHLALSTIRSYQCSLRLFTEFLIDGRYGWSLACEQAFGPGQHPVAIAHEWNTIAHLNDYEGNPEARPFTREEVQRFLDYADEQVECAVKGRRKGALAAYRDATLFKVIYGWGLRRTETSKLDVVDFGRNAAAAEFGRYGMLSVRYGKAKKGQPPRRRSVAAVMGWAVEAVADYVENVRPRFGCADHPALWVTERGGRVKPAEINARFVAYRDALGLPAALVVHSLRHSAVICTAISARGTTKSRVRSLVPHTPRGTCGRAGTRPFFVAASFWPHVTHVPHTAKQGSTRHFLISSTDKGRHAPHRGRRGPQIHPNPGWSRE